MTNTGAYPDQLRHRLGHAAFDLRCVREGQRTDILKKRCNPLLNLLERPPVYPVAKWLLRRSGLEQRGHRNYLNFHHESHQFGRFDPDREPYRILQLSDLHCDLDDAFIPALVNALKGIKADLTVITGDFCNAASDTLPVAIDGLHALLSSLPKPIFACLGNHDSLAIVEPLESMGIQCLLNEHIILQSPFGNLALCGVDDPFFFQTHDLKQARKGLPEKMPKILLAHSPDIVDESDIEAYDFIMSGHTHAGQICRPSGKPWIQPGSLSSDLIAGPWQRGKCQGYTHRGTGACLLPLRFYCPPEITVHTIYRP